jgi:hypothetical protein
MKFNESQAPQEPKAPESASVYEPKVLPLKDAGQIFPYDGEDHIPKEEDVVEKVWLRLGPGAEGKRIRYCLVSPIAGLQYYFRLAGDENEKTYHVAFKTLEYQYAITNLDKESLDLGAKKLADFLETAYKDSQGSIQQVEASPSGDPYTVREIEDCIEKILQTTKKYSEEELRERYKGFRIFDVYKEVMGKGYHKVHYNHTNKTGARERYFKMKAKQYLKKWEEVDDVWGRELLLQRKNPNEIAK